MTPAPAMAELSAAQIDMLIRRRNLKTFWRLRWELTMEQRGHLEDLCYREWGLDWRKMIELEHG